MYHITQKLLEEYKKSQEQTDLLISKLVRDVDFVSDFYGRRLHKLLDYFKGTEHEEVCANVLANGSLHVLDQRPGEPLTPKEFDIIANNGWSADMEYAKNYQEVVVYDKDVGIVVAKWLPKTGIWIMKLSDMQVFPIFYQKMPKLPNNLEDSTV